MLKHFTCLFVRSNKNKQAVILSDTSDNVKFHAALLLSYKRTCYIPNNISIQLFFVSWRKYSTTRSQNWTTLRAKCLGVLKEARIACSSLEKSRKCVVVKLGISANYPVDYNQGDNRTQTHLVHFCYQVYDDGIRCWMACSRKGARLLSSVSVQYWLLWLYIFEWGM
jgi:hypothetical protein